MYQLSSANLAFAKLCDVDLSIAREYKKLRDVYREVHVRLKYGMDYWNFNDTILATLARIDMLINFPFPDTDDPVLPSYMSGLKHKLDTIKLMQQYIA